MATKQFTGMLKDTNYYVEQLHAIADGAKFPIRISVDAGKIANITYETTWDEGTVTPVEAKARDGEEIATDYVQNYSAKKLTPAQIKKIDDYITANLIG